VSCGQEQLLLSQANKNESVIDDPEVEKLAKEVSMTPAQMLISWAIQRNTCVLPKSVTSERIISNLEGEETCRNL
jgi:diketogulonate reductase-like aldo/keto reductase